MGGRRQKKAHKRVLTDRGTVWRSGGKMKGKMCEVAGALKHFCLKPVPHNERNDWKLKHSWLAMKTL